MDDLKEKLSKWLELDYILPEDIPNIDLYMDHFYGHRTKKFHPFSGR